MTAFHFTLFNMDNPYTHEFEMKKENEKNQTQTKESSGIIRSTKKEFKAKKREIKRYHSTIAKSNRKEKREKLAELKQNFIDGCKNNHRTEGYGEKLFELILKFCLKFIDVLIQYVI